MTTITLGVGSNWTDDCTEVDILKERLIDEGFTLEVTDWRDGADAFEGTDAVIIRACWDYHQHPNEFEQWIRNLGALDLSVWNPPDMLLWNMNKRYLKDLRDTGMPIIPSAFVPVGSNLPLIPIMQEKQWETVVIKPLIGAGSDNMLRLTADEVDNHSTELEEMIDTTGLVIQPYLEHIKQNGEWSFIFFGGEYQYAVHKSPADGDYRVQEEHGGTYEHRDPEPAVVDQASKWIRRITKPWMYLRMDAIVSGDELQIMEIEALEPSFYLDTYPDGANQLVETIHEYVVEGNVYDPATFVVE